MTPGILDWVIDPEASAVIVPLPDVDPVVTDLRATLDPTAAWDVPPHITVLAPFLPPHRIGAPELDTLRAAVASVPAFDATLVEIRWFGTDVVWLAPEPAEPFRVLTAAVGAAFPQCPPYGGAFPDVVPHLTVGARADLAILRAAAAALTELLPISIRTVAAHLYVGSEGTAWRSAAELPLGRPANAGR